MLNSETINYAKKITPGLMTTSGRKLAVLATLGGNVELTLSGGDKHVVSVPIGYSEFEFAVVKVTAGGLTTATATFTNLL